MRYKIKSIYQYDPSGRIEHVHTKRNGSAPHDERFRFDPEHNLIERDNQIIKNNRISHYAGVGFTYDCLGNPLATTYDRDNRVRYRYDLHDRLIGAEISTRYRKERWVYYYDAVGRRIAKAKLNKQGELEIHTLFVWDGSHLVQEIQKGKNAQENDRTFTYIYTHPNSYEPLAQCIGRKDENHNRIDHEINYFHCDQIGIPREMTDSQGKLIWRGRYDAWGGLHYDRHLAQQNQGHQPFRLQNQYIDQETGLHYNFLRYYEPMTGRFITQDPIGLAGGMNFYQFAPNVQAWIDVSGAAAQIAAGCAAGALGGPLGCAVGASASVLLSFFAVGAVSSLLTSDTCSKCEEEKRKKCNGQKEIRMRHFTNSKGISGIQATNVIIPSDQNKVFAVPAKGKPLSAADFENKFKLKRGRAKHYVDFDTCPGEFVPRLNSLNSKAIEYTHDGPFYLNGRNPTYHRNN
ncbi:RHS repeat-associated core domain-containing protein [Rodentibacter caecimuris]|uniref:RHS repeat-associated core domain-containing protein n=2 Tax=Rodentibacter caecimuris TaxID=1796644 RepID=UPI0014414516|nr:RHS repeat-associated core domain-containing protein [Pasteurella caecimuris]